MSNPFFTETYSRVVARVGNGWPCNIDTLRDAIYECERLGYTPHFLCICPKDYGDLRRSMSNERAWDPWADLAAVFGLKVDVDNKLSEGSWRVECRWEETKPLDDTRTGSPYASVVRLGPEQELTASPKPKKEPPPKELHPIDLDRFRNLPPKE